MTLCLHKSSVQTISRAAKSTCIEQCSVLNGTIGYFIGLFVASEHRHRKQFKMHLTIPIHRKNYQLIQRFKKIFISRNQLQLKQRI